MSTRAYHNANSRLSQQRVTNDQIIAAYRQTGSVWKAAKLLGIIGQSVWERLKSIGYPMSNRRWTQEEKVELTGLIQHCTLADIAGRLGRPYYGVAIMASRMGIATRAGSKIKRKVPRGVGLTKETTRAIVRDLRAFDGPLRKFCRMRGFSIDNLAIAIQNYAPQFWTDQAALRGFKPRTCPNCDTTFYPMTPKQATCTRRCSSQRRKNIEYFGGRRNEALGLLEKVCQLCLKPREKGLHAHHVLGKQNDPDNAVLVALCAGCHQIVGKLAVMGLADSEEGWQRLIELVMARRLAENGDGFAGTYVCVDLEYLTTQQCIDEGLLPETSIAS